ncbi:hypothetical protein ACHAW5_000069 [Stephanodiscus triporus]|uniref:Aminotransferase class I/classII large domain-containing protein n=1 Tax=Stephanodiscus triporus TaxID=2934178 RepID=A0ABD3NEW3_9STRA
MPPFSPFNSATTAVGGNLSSCSSCSSSSSSSAWTIRRLIASSVVFLRHHGHDQPALGGPTAAASSTSAFVLAAAAGDRPADIDGASMMGGGGGGGRRVVGGASFMGGGAVAALRHRRGRGGGRGCGVVRWLRPSSSSSSSFREEAQRSISTAASSSSSHPPGGGIIVAIRTTSSPPSTHSRPTSSLSSSSSRQDDDDRDGDAPPPPPPRPPPPPPPPRGMLSSSRARAAIGLLPSYLADARSVSRYSPSNPDGALQLGVAESRLCEFPVGGLVGIVEGGGGGGWDDDVVVFAADVVGNGNGNGRNGMGLTDVLGRLASSDVAPCASEDDDDDDDDDGGGGAPPPTTTTTRIGVFEREMAYYQPTHGTPGARRAMAGYLRGLLLSSSSSSSMSSTAATFDPENVVLGAGCNAVLENLCMCLADPGDAVLIPAPYYAAFEFDLAARAGCRIVPTYGSGRVRDSDRSTSSSSSCGGPIPPEYYYPSMPSLDDAYDRAVRETGRPPRVLLISHPNNPLGICYPPRVVRDCIDWCRERGVHLISDEIYAGSVYREERTGGEDAGPTFVSAMALGGGPRDSARGLGLGPYIHLVYALSKDFALSGLRVGVAYTENEEILLPLQKLNDLCQISSQTQLLVERMLRANAVVAVEDGDDGSGGRYDTSRKFTDVYLRANRDNVRARCDELHSFLDEIGVPYLPADSGLFVWMDLREFLPNLPDGATEAEESNDSKERRERQLYLSLMKDYGLLFTPGMSMRNERAGFFRFVFTAASEEEFERGLTRLRKFVQDMRRR